MIAKFGDKQSIQRGERKPVGYYRHNGPEPIVNTRRDFETASYSETTEIPPGVYPIYPGWRDGRHGGEASLYVEFKGTVTNDYFPASLGGVVIGDTKPKHIGESRTVSKQIDVVSAVKNTGTSPNNTPNKEGKIPPDIYISPKIWDDISSFYEEILEEDLKYFKSVVERVENGEKSLADSTSTIKYCAACIQGSSAALETISQSKGYLKNPTFSTLHKNNTKWIPKEEEKTKFKKEPVPEMG
jgi:hypothetical protein